MPAVDLIIRNATLIDGTGGPAQPGDLSVYGDVDHAVSGAASAPTSPAAMSLERQELALDVSALEEGLAGEMVAEEFKLEI